MRRVKESQYGPLTRTVRNGKKECVCSGWADLWFRSGLILTGIGGILQTLGGILPLDDGDSVSGSLGTVVTRGAEGWQFLAFIFGALLVLVYGLIDELAEQ